VVNKWRSEELAPDDLRRVVVELDEPENIGVILNCDLFFEVIERGGSHLSAKTLEEMAWAKNEPIPDLSARAFVAVLLNLDESARVAHKDCGTCQGGTELLCEGCDGVGETEAFGTHLPCAGSGVLRCCQQDLELAEEIAF
jgi:hypothetical protein